MLGQVYEQKGDSMAAAAEYGKAIEVLAEDPDSDHPDRATELFERIRSLAPTSPETMRLASFFDPGTGKIRTSASVARPVSEPGDGLPVLEAPPSAISDLGEASSVSVAQAPQVEEPPLEAVPTAALPPSDEVLPVSDAVPPSPESIEYQEADVSGSSAVTEELGAPNLHDTIIAISPVREIPAEGDDRPLKLTEETAPLTASSISSETEGTGAGEPGDGAATGSVEMQKEASPVVGEPMAVSDLSLREVTQPIAEAPSAPRPMPWDQVQDTTLAIPLPSVEPAEEWDQASSQETHNQEAQVEEASVQEPQVEEAQTFNHEDHDLPLKPTESSNEQPPLPVLPEVLLSSLSWEEILAAVGKRPEPSATSTPVESETFLRESEHEATRAQHHSLVPAEPVLTPISEPVAEEQDLPLPMPWEQVEEESVSILPQEPEPELGAISEQTESPFIEDTVPHEQPSAPDGANDETVVLPAVTAASLEATVQLEREPAASTPSQDEETSLPCMISEPLIASSSPDESSGESSTSDLSVGDTDLPDTVEEQVLVPANAATDAPQIAASSAEPHEDCVQDSPFAQPIEPSGSEPGLEWIAPDEAVTGHDAIVAEPVSMQAEAAKGLNLGRDDADEKGVHEPDSTPDSAPGMVPDKQPPADAPVAISGDLKILWDDPAQPLTAEPAGAGLLSRWFRKPKPHVEPAAEIIAAAGPCEAEGPSDSAAPPSSITVSIAEETSAVTAPCHVPVHPCSPALSVKTPEKPVSPKTKKPLMGALAGSAGSGVIALIGACFSTTRSLIVTLIVLASATMTGALACLGIVALAWMFMEERPSAAFHTLSVEPRRTLEETSRNGYLLLLGFDRGTSQDPVQAGLARKFERADLATTDACLTNSREQHVMDQAGPQKPLAAWYQDSDPAARFRAQATAVRTWTAKANQAMARYSQWLTMPFEDWGYGEPVSPNCPAILETHRLYLAEGFAQDIDAGIGRLEIDLAMWRQVMIQAKGLAVKMLATDAVNDDAAILSGLLARADLDERLFGRLAKLARPLDQMEQSLRWPMQGELAAAPKVQEMVLTREAANPVPLHVALFSLMPMPAQRRLNQYADYYQTSGKASGAPFAGLPQRSDFVRYPAETWLDYGLNPIENVLGVPSLPDWRAYTGRILELDAKLRLAGLQAWIRRSPQEQDVLTRIAKGGQALYDPFTGFPMLVNARKRLIYSVAQDGKDDDGRAGVDIAAAVPLIAGATSLDGREGTSSTRVRR
jgi:hypothetical protein